LIVREKMFGQYNNKVPGCGSSSFVVRRVCHNSSLFRT